MIHSLNLKKTWLAGLLVVLIAGVSVGAMYAAKAAGETDQTLTAYLDGYFQSVQFQNNNMTVFKTALADNFKLFLVIFICGFFRLGVIGAAACVGVKGFISGFTTAALVKYYGAKGLLVNLCGLPATLLLFPVLIFFAVQSAGFAFAREKWNKSSVGRYLLLSLVCLTIFCISAFADGFLTTTFMKLFAHIFVGN